MDKVVASPEQAVADISDGATIAIAGFSVGHRFATSLILALREKGTKELTLVCNSLGDPGATRGQILAENKQVKKLIAAFSVRPGTPTASEAQITAGEMEVELVPQGILVERCRAGGAGIPAFYSPTSVGTGARRRQGRSASSTASPTSSSMRSTSTTPSAEAIAPIAWATSSSAAAARTSIRASPRPRASRSSKSTRSWSPARSRRS